MVKLKTVACATTLTAALAGCAGMQPQGSAAWVKPDTAPTTFGQDKFKCLQSARSQQSGGLIYGGIAAANSHETILMPVFQSCMEGKGYSLERHHLSPDALARVAQANQQRIACVENIRSKPTYSPLLPHFSNLRTGYSPGQLANSSTPSASEARLLAEYNSESMPCIDQFSGTMASVVPAYQSHAAPTRQQGQAVIADWVAQRISWGEGAQRLNQLRDEDQAWWRSL
jgi:hypothetical protein